MPLMNADKPHLWKEDIARSVDFYNSWFLDFAPITFRQTRQGTVQQVDAALAQTNNLVGIGVDTLIANPKVLSVLRMATAPPIARDRLVGLSGISRSLVDAMEVDGRMPPRINAALLRAALERIILVFNRLADKDILTWLEEGAVPSEEVRHRAAIIIADRLCGALADPIVRNAQEKRQLAVLAAWLEARGYKLSEARSVHEMLPGTFAFRINVPVSLQDGLKQVNIPIDAAIKPLGATDEELPILVEAKSAGDFANVNKRRKEEAVKITQLRHTYGPAVRFVLLLCGYFDSGYLGYEAAEGIDWVWEHRLDDLGAIGL